jgi:hypothetical protein
MPIAMWEMPNDDSWNYLTISIGLVIAGSTYGASLDVPVDREAQEQGRHRMVDELGRKSPRSAAGTVMVLHAL